ncbi:hypothetical protein ABW19_dt0204403 [Dactylella cylindrospora]|nr:hypothetical protein ABW19_dt0204403 [Dactylella cylindrospora]
MSLFGLRLPLRERNLPQSEISLYIPQKPVEMLSQDKPPKGSLAAAVGDFFGAADEADRRHANTCRDARVIQANRQLDKAFADIASAGESMFETTEKESDGLEDYSEPEDDEEYIGLKLLFNILAKENFERRKRESEDEDQSCYLATVEELIDDSQGKGTIRTRTPSIEETPTEGESDEEGDLETTRRNFLEMGDILPAYEIAGSQRKRRREEASQAAECPTAAIFSSKRVRLI